MAYLITCQVFLHYSLNKTTYGNLLKFLVCLAHKAFSAGLGVKEICETEFGGYRFYKANHKQCAPGKDISIENLKQTQK